VIAEKLGKFVWEVEQLDPDEYYEWLAYFEIQYDQAKKAQAEAQRKSKRNNRT